MEQGNGARTTAGSRPQYQDGGTAAGGSVASDGPLTGLRVLDCSTVLAGPLCCQLLADFGADVIKVEHPRLGDSLRGHGPQKNGVPLWWKIVSRNKRTLGLLLSDPEGAELLLQLAADTDVLVENFRPGTLERWGLGWERLHKVNPRLILVRVTGFGQDGPYAGRAAFGTLIEAMSGFAAMTGEAEGPPTLPPFGLADGIAAISAVSATLLALYHRDARGGEAQVVDLAILDPLVTVLGPQPTAYDQLGIVPARTGNLSANNAPRNTYLTKDGRWVALSSSATPVAERVMRLVGRDDLVAEPWFSTGAGRAEHLDLIDPAVTKWIGSRDLDEVLTAFESVGAAIAPVCTVADLAVDPQVLHRETLTNVADPDLGNVLMQGLLFKLSATPGSIRFTGRRLGADTDEILGKELGVDPSRIEQLRERGVIA